MPDEVEKKSITLWTVLFIATQIPESLLRTCEQVNQLLSQQCQYQLIVPESMAFQTWKTQITQMNDLMSLWIHVQDRHQLVLDKFKDYLEKLKSRGFLISEEDTVCHYPWRIYKNAFEDGQGGLLQMNMQSLVYEIDKESKKLGLEIDLIAFAPTWDRAIATPRRFLRTPGKSIVSRSCTRNVLKNSCHSSSMNKSFLATPFSAVGMVGSRVPFAEKSTHQMLVELFPNRITNRDHLPEMIQNRFNNAVEKIVSKTGSKTKEIWDLSESIYYDLMIRLYSKLENQSQEFQNEVLHDGQFHRTIFCLAFEIVRFAKDYQSIGFQFLFQSCIANAPELYIMIKMLLEECIKTPQWPREVVKRLVGIQERILESDIWTDPSFYSFLTFANSSIENLPAMVADSYVMKLFSILCPKSVSTISYYPKQFMKEKPGKFSAFLYIYDSIMKLAKNRLERFFIEDSLAMTTQSQEEARKYMMMCIKNEHMLKLISGRHLDSIIIMSLYLGTRFDTANQKIRMIDIVTIYKTHPHFVQNAFYSIFVGPNQTTTITDFYDNVYLPKLRTVAPELQQSQTNPLSLSNIVNSNKLVLGTNESPFKIPKTPQTSQKLKKRLFASPRPPIGGSPLAKPPLAPNV